jgi:hypothetical protein
MTSKEWCTRCQKHVCVSKANKKEVIFVKGSPVTIRANMLKCEVCGLEIYTPELESENTKAAYAEYKRLNDLE